MGATALAACPELWPPCREEQGSARRSGQFTCGGGLRASNRPDRQRRRAQGATLPQVLTVPLDRAGPVDVPRCRSGTLPQQPSEECGPQGQNVAGCLQKG